MSGNRCGQRCVPKECKVFDTFQGRLMAKANAGGEFKHTVEQFFEKGIFFLLPKNHRNERMNKPGKTSGKNPSFRASSLHF